MNLVDDKQDIEKIVSTKQDTFAIKQHLHNIKEPYKEVFMWRYFGEMSFADIGKLYNKSENWACVTYYRAREMLKERLEEYYE